MKLAFLFYLLMTVSVIILSTNPGITLGVLAPKTSQQLYEQSNLIVTGTIIKAVGRSSERSTDYFVIVEKYLKGDLHQQTLQVNGIGKINSTIMAEDEPIFSKGQRVILYLTRNGSEFIISPYSHVLVTVRNATKAP